MAKMAKDDCGELFRYYYGLQTEPMMFQTNVGLRVFEKIIAKMIKRHKMKHTHSRLKRFTEKDLVLTVLPDGGSFCHRHSAETTEFTSQILKQRFHYDRIKNDLFPKQKDYEGEEIIEEFTFNISLSSKPHGKNCQLHLARTENPIAKRLGYEVFLESPEELSDAIIREIFHRYCGLGFEETSTKPS